MDKLHELLDEFYTKKTTEIYNEFFSFAGETDGLKKKLRSICIDFRKLFGPGHPDVLREAFVAGQKNIIDKGQAFTDESDFDDWFEKKYLQPAKPANAPAPEFMPDVSVDFWEKEKVGHFKFHKFVDNEGFPSAIVEDKTGTVFIIKLKHAKLSFSRNYTKQQP